MSDKVEAEADRWGPEIARPDFIIAAAGFKFQSTVKLLSIRIGAEAQPGEVPGSFTIDSSKEVNIVDLQREFLPKGCFLFSLKYDSNRNIGVLPTTNKYDAIAAMQTNGQNYDIGPGYINDWLKKLDAEQPFFLTGAGMDFLSGQFQSPVNNAVELAARFYEFCPDIVDQGCGSVEVLADELKKTQKLFFWWD